MFNVKDLRAAVEQISETRQLPEEVLWEAIESAFAAAYKREYAKHDHIIRARVNIDTGSISFFQAKTVLGSGDILPEGESPQDEGETRVRFNPERHIMVEDARRVQHSVEAGQELLFPLEEKDEFGRIAAQAARQAIAQKLHAAEREAVVSEFEGREGSVASGKVQRVERGNVFVDLGRTVAILPFSEQIRGERFRQGEVMRALIASVDTGRKQGGFIRLSRASPQFVVKLFELEVPEMAQGIVRVKSIAREPGSRSKIAVESTDHTVDPVGALVGQRGVRVLAVRSELSGEQLDIIEWASDPQLFVEEALSPAQVMRVATNEDGSMAVSAADNQIALVIGKSGQNLRLASRLTKRKLLVFDMSNTLVAETDEHGQVQLLQPFHARQTREQQEDAEQGSEDVPTADTAPQESA